MTRRISAAPSLSRAEPARGGRPVHALVAGTIAFSLVITGTTVVNVALPDIGADFGASVGALQWVSNAYTLLFGSLLLSMGAQSDRRGARRVMLAGVTLFVAGATVAGLAPALGWLLAGQVLLGTGAAAMTPAALALISHAHPDHDQRARAIGIFASASAVAIGIGPVLGGVLIEAIGWRAVFALDIPVALTVAFVVARMLGETPLRPAHAADVAGTIAGILALGSLTFGIIESGERGWGAPLTLSALAAGLVAGAAFVAIERRAASPMLPLSLFAPLRFRTAVGAGVGVNLAVYGILFVLSLYLQSGARLLTARDRARVPVPDRQRGAQRPAGEPLDGSSRATCPDRARMRAGSAGLRGARHRRRRDLDRGRGRGDRPDGRGRRSGDPGADHLDRLRCRARAGRDRDRRVHRRPPDRRGPRGRAARRDAQRRAARRRAAAGGRREHALLRGLRCTVCRVAPSSTRVGALS